MQLNPKARTRRNKTKAKGGDAPELYWMCVYFYIGLGVYLYPRITRYIHIEHDSYL